MKAGTAVEEGTVAWISGGAQGIGLALGQMLCAKGCRVVLADICDQAKGARAALSCGHGAVYHQVDVTKPAQVRRSLDQARHTFGRCPTVCVNNAGVVAEPEPGRMLRVNLEAVIQGCRVQEGMMREAGLPGVVLVTASLAGLVPVAMTPAYAASKWGAIGWTLSWAAELSQKAGGCPAVRVNAVCPSLVDTPDVGGFFKEQYDKAGGLFAKLRKQIVQPGLVALAMLQLIQSELHGQLALVSGRHSWIHQPDFASTAKPPEGAQLLARSAL